MKKKFLFLAMLFIFMNCRTNSELNNESFDSLFRTIFYSENLKQNKDVVDLLNKKILESDFYDYKIIISDNLMNGVDYNISILNDDTRTPDINSLSICYKSKDFILVNNLKVSQENLDEYLKDINVSREQIFTEFSIDSSKSGHLTIKEWENCISLLKRILKNITEKQITNKTSKPYRMLFTFKGLCYPTGNGKD